MIIGYTNGYFDILHRGHLSTLQKAAALCDTLIVGVISDEHCRERKGKTPVIPLDQRLEIISSLACVGLAVPVYCDDKEIEWRSYKFNKLFVGSDHKNSPIWEIYEEVFKKFGVDIIYLPYTQEVSSTKIKLRIIDEAMPKKSDLR